MRAYQLPKGGAGIDALHVFDRPMPKPQYRQVLVKVAACSLNFRDHMMVCGSYPMAVRENLVPLSDGAGEVVEIGPGVLRVKAGDKVAGCFFQRWPGGEPGPHLQAFALGGSIDGMLAEYVVLEEDGVVKLPAHLSLEEGAALPCAAVTAWHAMFHHAKLIAGQTVLLQGTGGVSIFGLQLAHAMGITAIVTSSSDEKLARAKALGAACGINYKTTPEWEKAAVTFNGGRGVDHVIEVGGPDSFLQSLQAIRIGGQINMVGYIGSKEGAINPLEILYRRATVRGIPVGSRESFEAMNRAIETNKMRPVIDKVFPWTDAVAAIRYMQKGKHFGKIILKF